MRVLVCGGRDFWEFSWAREQLDNLNYQQQIWSIIEGGARGGDCLGRAWALLRGVPCTTVNAAWALHGKKAGILRNIKMLEEYRPDLVVAFPGGRGTAHMVRIAREAGVEVRPLSPPE